MTDTTDIKALRAGLTEQLDHMECYGGKGWVNQEDIRSILNSLDQLEAERQRADDVVKAHRVHAARLIDDRGQLRERAEKAEAEIAALKAKLANPVVLPNVTTERADWTTWQWIEHLGGRFQNGNPGDYVEFGSVFAVQQMLTQFGRTMMAQTIPLCADAIREAGFTVKGDL